MPFTYSINNVPVALFTGCMARSATWALRWADAAYGNSPTYSRAPWKPNTRQYPMCDLRSGWQKRTIDGSVHDIQYVVIEVNPPMPGTQRTRRGTKPRPPAAAPPAPPRAPAAQPEPPRPPVSAA